MLQCFLRHKLSGDVDGYLGGRIEGFIVAAGDEGEFMVAHDRRDPFPQQQGGDFLRLRPVAYVVAETDDFRDLLALHIGENLFKGLQVGMNIREKSKSHAANTRIWSPGTASFSELCR